MLDFITSPYSYLLEHMQRKGMMSFSLKQGYYIETWFRERHSELRLGKKIQEKNKLTFKRAESKGRDFLRGAENRDGIEWKD